ncbi:MAG: TfoX/Sxy family protein [Steroidobacteraceae bacterium]|nr:TfoX/Sxy family protein [Nevskiaceae bacterium]MCP5338981.1 TfoX/Sxy family protein [Nevskiaceae bacterium]MCP5359607.1 TfoX/Sxy family protein [Nevskiaceae bacterium]MCP5472600.1 TfoX/Sxy family protein [Nevskiaceae bacterium]
MRNSKVRRRIAAGKLRLRIRDLRNLGPRSEALLEQVGIRSADALRRHGAVAAFVALRRSGATRSLNMLWAMAGALDPWPEGRHWRDVAAGEQRLALLLAVDAAGLATPRERGSERGRGRRRSRHLPAGAAMVGSTTLGAWAPGLPFDEAAEVNSAAVAAGVRSGRPRKARSRHKAGS